MRAQALNLAYFSPTGTTRKILIAIAKGLGDDAPHECDLTLSLPFNCAADPESLIILGAPTYAGRVPALAAERFSHLRGNGAPAVVVVTYGNRAYEDALIELRDIAIAQGFVPVAAGAFIGEHSFSTPEKPLAMGRPNEDDLERAANFGLAVGAKLAGLSPESLAGLPRLDVPGNPLYKERPEFTPVAPVTDENLCNLCGACAVVCPAAAITVIDRVTTDASVCIRCCACVKSCPMGARALNAPRVEEARARLFANCQEPKTPETFL